MKYESRSTSGIPTSMIPAHVAALMNEPTYVTHLVFDESATKSFLVVVFGEEDSAKVRSGRGPGCVGVDPVSQQKGEYGAGDSCSEKAFNERSRLTLTPCNSRGPIAAPLRSRHAGSHVGSDSNP